MHGEGVVPTLQRAAGSAIWPVCLSCDTREAIGLDAKFIAAHASPTSLRFASAQLRLNVTREQGAATLKRSRAAHD